MMDMTEVKILKNDDNRLCGWKVGTVVQMTIDMAKRWYKRGKVDLLDKDLKKAYDAELKRESRENSEADSTGN